MLHGPHVANFADVYKALDLGYGAVQVEDAHMLAQRAHAWLQDETARARAAESAREIVEGLGGALEKTLQALEPYLMQLRLGQGAHHA